MGSCRSEAVKDMLSRQPRVIDFPADQLGKKLALSEIFGSCVFDMKRLASSLPKPVYKQFKNELVSEKVLSKYVADAVAHAVRIWAQERGATHYTHWFQPQTGRTAEKHDSFLTLKSSEDGMSFIALDTFSGSALTQAEPDASSFPHGGVRSTFEARGYSVWDPTSPMFISEGPHGTSTLMIPSIFISYNGEALDEKTGLLRSIDSVAKASLKMLHLVGVKAAAVFPTLGTEQEFFLVDRGLYSHRPDLKMTGRTLIGQVPPKHQQLEDHYFGQMPSRVLATISEAELELWKLGVPVKTRHNEVAPNQFEIAPIFENANLAVDHNLLTMEVLHKVAHRHKLKVLFHEKPFKGVNGSGKHCNWSLQTDTGLNLLEPTENPEENLTFLLFLVSCLRAVQLHGGLLRAAIASASNDHRLGANEAPPAIVSAFLGEHLNEVLDAVEEGRPVRPSVKPYMKNVRLGGTVLDVKVPTCPEIARDKTDRNRTSPFAFTGNKFEFRAVGSNQSPSFPVTVLNAAVASSLDEIRGALETASAGKNPSKDTILSILKQYIGITRSVRFEGNNYSTEWSIEAEKRGLLNIRASPAAYEQLLLKENAAMLIQKESIYDRNELEARYHVLNENYSKLLVIEALTLSNMISQSVLPAAISHRCNLAKSVNALTLANQKSTTESKLCTFIGEWIEKLSSTLVLLEAQIDLIRGHIEEPQASIKAFDLVECMEKVRECSDALENVIPDEQWPFPKYMDILFC